jgi:putative nucleotidyltransferase with HDIG domain
MRLPSDEASGLVHAALTHHRPDLMSTSALSRLMDDLGLCASNAYSDYAETSALAEQVLTAFGTSPANGPNSRARELARLLEAVNALDEQIEFAPYEQDPIDSVLQSALVASRSDAAITTGTILRQLRIASREDLLSVMPNLPVYPAVAVRLYRLLGSDQVNLSTLETIAHSDQVVAGKLINAANSAWYSPRQPIRSVAQAIGYVGTEEARRILLASSVQPLFSSPRMRKLWKHALEAAQVAERIAELSGKVDPAEAFLVGLLHDVGKLGLSLLSRKVNDAIERLIAKGCQAGTAELVLCGIDHAEAGAEVLKYWKFADELISAVQHHHQPERASSRLAAVLYLTEFWTDSEEDLPSNARLTMAMKMTSVNAEALDAARASLKGTLACL